MQLNCVYFLAETIQDIKSDYSVGGTWKKFPFPYLLSRLPALPSAATPRRTGLSTIARSHMKRIFTSTLLAVTVPASIHAQSAEISEAAATYPEQFCEDAHGGPKLVIEPFISLQGVMGHNGLEGTGLAQGAHDPRHTGFNLTGISLGTDILYSEHLAAYAEGIFTWNNEDGWDAELEEAYAKFMNLPGDFDIRAGRMFAHVGTQNNLHSHAWNFVDANLANVRFLGDDGLITEGLELQWVLPTPWNNRLIVSFGHPLDHDHDHGHSEHEGHHDDDHDDDDDDHDDEVGGHNEEAEMALWDKDVLTARYEASFWPGDTCHFQYGASYIQGKNKFDRWSRLYGLDVTYTWVEDEIDGENFIWRNELMWRDIDTDEGDFNELGFNSTMIWSPNIDWELALRYDWLEGVDDPELAERQRISPSVTRYFDAGPVEVLTRLQYNYDHSDQHDNEHSIWLQFGFEWASGDNHMH